MTRSPQKKKSYHHGDLRDALLQSALGIIAEGDLGTLSLRGLARRAGVSPAAPYHHFEDKKALLAAVAEQGFLMMSEVMEEELRTLPPDAQAIDRMCALGRGYILFSVRHSAHFQVMFNSELRDKKKYGQMHSAANHCFGSLLREVEAALGERATPQSVQALAVTAWSTVHGAATLWIQGSIQEMSDGEPTLEQIAHVVTETTRGLVLSALE